MGTTPPYPPRKQGGMLSLASKKERIKTNDPSPLGEGRVRAIPRANKKGGRWQNSIVNDLK